MLTETSRKIISKVIYLKLKLHLEPIKKCIPIQNQSAIISYLKNIFELESRLDAIFLLEKVTKKNNASVASYGEVLSSILSRDI